MDKILASLVEFSTTLAFRDLPPATASAAADRVLDSLGCALGAYDCDTADVARALAAPAARPELAGCIIGSKDPAAADGAAFVNTCMIRYMDLNDGYPGGHPSDALGALFAVAPQIGASGERLLAATVVAYEIFVRLQRTRLREKGWDQGFAIGVSAAAGLANLSGLNAEAARSALAITAVANMPMRATRAGQLSMWKGAATAYAVRNAVFGVQLAAAGMTGPEAPFTGRHGLEDLITGPLELDRFGTTEADFFLSKTNVKYWPVAYSLQALIWAGIELRKHIRIEDIASIDVRTSQFSWSESGSEPAKWDPTSRETADHSIPYILAWTLRHGTVDYRTFLEPSYLDPTIRPLMQLTTVSVDDAIERDDRSGNARIRVVAKDRSGKTHEADILNPLGHAKNPVSPKELAEKFVGLCERALGKERAGAALALWQQPQTMSNTKRGFEALEVPGR